MQLLQDVTLSLQVLEGSKRCSIYVQSCYRPAQERPFQWFPFLQPVEAQCEAQSGVARPLFTFQILYSLQLVWFIGFFRLKNEKALVHQ